MTPVQPATKVMDAHVRYVILAWTHRAPQVSGSHSIGMVGLPPCLPPPQRNPHVLIPKWSFVFLGILLILWLICVCRAISSLASGLIGKHGDPEVLNKTKR